MGSTKKTGSWVKLVAAVLTVLGLAAAAVGFAFLVSGVQQPERTKKDYDDCMRDAKAYTESEQTDLAIASYQEALDLKDNDPDALKGLAEIYYSENNDALELSTREKLEDADDTDLDNKVRVISLLVSTGKLDDAKDKAKALIGGAGADNADLKELYASMTPAAPSFNLKSGSYKSYQLLTLEDGDGDDTSDGLTVYYTTDGSEPTTDSSVFPDDGLVISYPKTTIRAVAYSGLGYKSDETKLDLKITKKAKEISLDSEEAWDLYSSYFYDDLGKDWGDPMYDYDLAQIREYYLAGDGSGQTHEITGYLKEDTYSLYNDSNWSEEKGQGSLSFVQYMPYLTTLCVDYQEKLDLSPLSKYPLTTLQNLSLINDGITDITPLKGLTSLQKLSLGWNSISDVSVLSSLTELSYLGLWNNKISDVSKLSGLTQLSGLDLSHNRISDISCVGTMPDLSELRIDHNKVTDLTPLENCSTLRVLLQGGNPVTEYGSLLQNTDQFYQTDLSSDMQTDLSSDSNREAAE